MSKNNWSRQRLDDLRNELKALHLDGIIIPRVDEFQGEYVPPSSERLAWITAFTGSAGTAVILADKAVLFTDGRYTLQAGEECDGSLFDVCHAIDCPLTDWLSDHLSAGQKIGFDARLTSSHQQAGLSRACKKAGGELIPLEENPIDKIWQDRPDPPTALAVPYDETLAGQTSADKRQDIAKAIAAEGQDAVVLTAGDSVNWLLNIRGADVPFTPFVLAHAILHKDATVDLFLDPDKTSPQLKDHLGPAVRIHPPGIILSALDRLGTDKQVIGIDPAVTPYAFVERLKAKGATLSPSDDPCQLPKACKTAAEIKGMEAAHLRDGLALVKFLHWLDENAAGGTLTEMTAADRLEAFRRESDLLQDLSFPTISGAGPNGAIVHYRVDDGSNRPLEQDSLYLVDSGGQYLDGTTDVTRTIAIGKPPADAVRHFTLVLKGHIALSRAIFPVGTTGTQLDILARHALWQAGLDYDHGTGHGVGAYLSVHEGPQRISKAASKVALQPGMILSNEPGYYKTGAYGIRIENLVRVTTVPTPTDGDRDMLGFIPLTLAPIDKRLIDPSLLTPDETRWLDDYHKTVFEKLAPQLGGGCRDWLQQATAPL